MSKESNSKDEKIDLSELKKIYKDNVYGFLDACMPLSFKDNTLYFLSANGQLYGFDTKKTSFFEPNSTNKYTLINNCINNYFTDTIKKSLEEKAGVKFDELDELILRFNNREKHIGKKFFFCKSQNTIFIWNMVTSKWESADVDKMKHLFSNNEILHDQTKVYKSTKVTSFEDLQIDMDDLEQITARFRDCSIHYLHKDQNKIYSLNYVKGFWYIPEESIQKQILAYVAKHSVEEYEEKVKAKNKEKNGSESDNEICN